MSATFKRDARAWLEQLGVSFEERPLAHHTDLAGDGPCGPIRVRSWAAPRFDGLGTSSTGVALVKIDLGDRSDVLHTLATEWWSDGGLATYAAGNTRLTAVLHGASKSSISLASIERGTGDDFGERSFLGRVDQLARLPAAKRPVALRLVGRGAAAIAGRRRSPARRAANTFSMGLAGAAVAGVCALPLIQLSVIPIAIAAGCGALAGGAGGGYALARIGEAREPKWLRAALGQLRKSHLFHSVQLVSPRSNVWTGQVVIEGGGMGPAMLFAGARAEALHKKNGLGLFLDSFSLEISGHPTRAFVRLPRRWATVTVRLPEDRSSTVLGGLRASEEGGLLETTISEEQAAHGALESDVLGPLRAHLQTSDAGPYR